MKIETTKVTISDGAMLSEYVLLAEHWRTRALINAQACEDLRRENEELRAAIDAMTLQPDDAGEGEVEAENFRDDGDGEGGEA